MSACPPDISRLFGAAMAGALMGKEVVFHFAQLGLVLAKKFTGFRCAIRIFG